MENFISTDYQSTLYKHVYNLAGWEKLGKKWTMWVTLPDYKYDYTYGKEPYQKTMKPLAMTWPLKNLVRIACEKLRLPNTYNACNLNYYSDGRMALGFHADDEDIFFENGVEQDASTIISISLGAGRFFAFRHIESGETQRFFLKGGSALTMEGMMQARYFHAVPQQHSEPVSGRINLTFRTIKRPPLSP